MPRFACTIARCLLLAACVTLCLTSSAIALEEIVTLPPGAVSEFEGYDFGITPGPEDTIWSLSSGYNPYFVEQPVIWRATESGRLTGVFPIPPFHKERFQFEEGAGLAKGTNGEMWFFENQDESGSFAGRVNSAGLFHELGVEAYPEAIAVDGEGNAWLTTGNGTIDRITPTDQVSVHTVVGPTSKIPRITYGPEGKMWFMAQLFNPEYENRGAEIATISPDGSVSLLARLPYSSPTDMAITPDGAVWFVDPTNESLGRVEPSGIVQDFTVPNIGSSITTGADGNVWFTSNGAQDWIRRFTMPETITRYTPVFSGGVGPQEIAAGVHGDLWFTNGYYSVARVGHFVVPLTPVDLEAPSISGSPTEGQVLSASPGHWSNEPSNLAYQWQRCSPDGSSCTDLANETGTTHGLSVDDVGNTLRVVVVASNLGGSSASSASPTAVIAARAPTPPKIVDQHILTLATTGSWRFRRQHHRTAIKLLSLSHLPSGGSVQITCVGATCPFHRHVWKTGDKTPCKGHKCRQSGTIYYGQDMSNLFRGHALAPGARITITVTKPGWIGKTFQLKTLPRSEPQITITCTDPDSHLPSAC
jgi:streptogramin lyase